MEHLISSTAQVKETNIFIVKNALMRMGMATKIMAANETGLSVATCNSILNELESKGEIYVVALDSKPTGAGRPSKTYKINETYQLGCCLYITNEAQKLTMNYMIIDLLGNVVQSDSISQSIINYSVIKEFLTQLKEQYSSLSSISIGLPGIISQIGYIESCDIESLSDINITELIKSDFGMECFAENDMNLIAYGLFREKDYKKNSCVIAISFFENIGSGAGIIIDGKIYHGKSNFAGEVSFLPFDKDHGRRIRLPLAKSENSEMIAKTISAFVTILNPDVIMLTGKSINVTMMGPISEACTAMLPQKHMPELTFVQNTDHYYFSGLSQMILSTPF